MISKQVNNQPKATKEFSLSENSTAYRILVFIKNSLPVFEKEFKNANLQIHLEDDISDELVRFFNNAAIKQNLIFQFNAKIGVDFAIFVHPTKIGTSSIFMIEAKRLDRNHYDYVNGRNGGIERFKREQKGFGAHLKISAMIGYVQEETFDYWEERINKRINQQINSRTEIVWGEEDKLVPDHKYSNFISNHSRVSKTSITLYHYWISLN